MRLGDALSGGQSILRQPDANLPPELVELARLVVFIKRGTVSETVQQELGASEARRRDLRLALDRLAQADAFRASAADLAQKLGTILGDWTDITRKPVAQQRQLLRKLVPDRLTVTPHVDAKRKWVDWAGDLALEPIISGIAPAVGDVMPDDPMDRRWWPQRDSRATMLTYPYLRASSVLLHSTRWSESSRTG
jgi:hypothetical protein